MTHLCLAAQTVLSKSRSTDPQTFCDLITYGSVPAVLVNVNTKVEKCRSHCAGDATLFILGETNIYHSEASSCNLVSFYGLWAPSRKLRKERSEKGEGDLYKQAEDPLRLPKQLGLRSGAH